MTEKKRCIPCEKNKTIWTVEDAAAVAELKKREPGVERLIQRYGIVGVMRLLRIHFETLADKTDMEEHKLVFNLLSNYERILADKLGKTQPQVIEQTRKSLREAGVNY